MVLAARAFAKDAQQLALTIDGVAHKGNYFRTIRAADLQGKTIRIANNGDRPVQVGSHYHFAETNPGLSFDRVAAHGMRLDIAAGTAVRFEPGQSREVRLVPFGVARRVFGFNQKVVGDL